MQNIRLLLVDDETSFLNPVAKRLKKRGITPESASGGEQCLLILESQSIDVVVTDIKMPGMDGIQLLKAIKDKYPDIEVILLTGQASIQDGVEGIKAGAFDYLTKPIEIEQLLEKIHLAYEKIVDRQEKRKEAEFRVKYLEEVWTQIVQSEKLASLGRLAAGVAHEINNPLTGILLYGNMMLEKLEDNNPLKQHLKYVLEDANRCKEIVKNLLAYSRQNSPSKEQFELNSLVQSSLSLIEEHKIFKNISLVKEPADYSIPIYADKNQLTQVVINLVMNAVDAMDERGKLTIRTYRDGKSGMACLEVQDSGTGIPPELISKIFDPFFTTKMPGKGTGLGLSTIYGIVKENNGRISVKETSHEGTTFILELPIKDSKPDSIG
jgi:signal transduction histidine kinase